MPIFSVGVVEPLCPISAADRSNTSPTILTVFTVSGAKIPLVFNVTTAPETETVPVYRSHLLKSFMLNLVVL